MTSNIGSQWISEAAGDLECRAAAGHGALRHTFRPEFLNRIDDVIVFRRLTQELIKGIVRLQIAAAGKDPGAERSETGGQPRGGARTGARRIRSGLRREAAEAPIQKKIQDRLALMLLNGEIRAGTDRAGRFRSQIGRIRIPVTTAPGRVLSPDYS